MAGRQRYAGFSMPHSLRQGDSSRAQRKCDLNRKVFLTVHRTAAQRRRKGRHLSEGISNCGNFPSRKDPPGQRRQTQASRAPCRAYEEDKASKRQDSGQPGKSAIFLRGKNLEGEQPFQGRNIQIQINDWTGVGGREWATAKSS